MKELFDLAEVHPKKGKVDQKFLKALYEALSEQFEDDPKEKKWKGLSPAAQQWYNDAVDPATSGDDLPDLPDENADEDDEDEAPAKKAKANGRGRGKSKRAKAAEADDEDEAEADDEDEDEPKAKKGKGKAAKADKGKKAKGKGNGAGKRRGPPAFTDDQKIKVLVKNPHNEGSAVADRFAKIKSGMTVGAARKAGLSMMDLKCDVDRGNLSIK